jgi:hypothetical protein
MMSRVDVNQRSKPSGLLIELAAVLVLTAVLAGQEGPRFTPSPSMNFFVTSKGLDGGNLGGLAGADYHCQQLAEAAGSTKTFYAYLSNRVSNGTTTLNARDRVGKGPFYNATGVMVARDVNDLHTRMDTITKETALTEKGEPVRLHDILTGSQPDGTAYRDRADTVDHTCNGYTSNSRGSVQLGHSDRSNGSSWISAHPSKGCSQADLTATGGAGQFYCFAID